jgi:hypothetical protein
VLSSFLFFCNEEIMKKIKNRIIQWRKVALNVKQNQFD